MAGDKGVWGIDVGQCALKALKLQFLDEQAEAIAFDIVEYPKPLNTSDRAGDELTELLAQAVRTLSERNSMAGNSVVIGVPGYQAFTRFSKLPPVEKKQLPAIVQFEAGQQIPYDMDQVIWDYQTFSEEGSPDVEVGIFCMRKELLDRYLTPFAEADLQPVIVQPAPLALYNYLEHDAQRPGKTTMLLDIGAESTDLIVSDRATVWTRAIPIGGNNFTERLVEAFRLEFPKAENLKRTAATSKYARQVFQAMRPVYQDLVAEIQRSVGRYSQTHRNAKMDRCVGMGNGFRLPGLQKFLQQNLNIKVERVSAFNRLRAGPGLNAPTLNENVLALGVAYGLAIQGLGGGRIASNLLPPQIAKRAVWRRKRPWFAAAAACMLLASASLWARYLLDSSALARTTGGEEVSVPSLKEKAIIKVINATPGQPSPRQYAANILGAANSLSGTYRKYVNEVKDAEASVQGVMALVDDQALWSKMIDVIHKSLIKKEISEGGALGEEDEKLAKLIRAKTLEEYLAAAKAIKRKHRELIFVDLLQTRYAANVAELVGPLMGEEEEEVGRTRGSGSRDRGKASKRSSRSSGRSTRGSSRSGSKGGSKGGGQGAPLDRADGRGFIVTIRGYTPYERPGIIKEFRERLNEMGNPKDLAQAERLGFHVLMPRNEPRLVLRDAVAAMRLAEQSTQAAPSTPGQGQGDLARDPVTGEVWVGDWTFTMSFGVALGPSPAASEAAPPGGGKSGRRGGR